MGFFNGLVFFNGQSSEELLVVVGGGAAGVFGAIRAKTLAPNLKVVVIEKGKPLSKVCVLLHILGKSYNKKKCYLVYYLYIYIFKMLLFVGENIWRW